MNTEFLAVLNVYHVVTLSLLALGVIRVKIFTLSAISPELVLKHTKIQPANKNPTTIDRNASLLVVILSSRNGAKSRKAIRETWLSDDFSKSRAVFLVGNRFQSDPDLPDVTNILKTDFLNRESSNDLSLKSENNVVMLPMVDSYQNLTLKVKLGVKWMIENTDAKWLLKVDDDVYADLRRLDGYLKQFDHTTR